MRLLLSLLSSTLYSRNASNAQNDLLQLAALHPQNKLWEEFVEAFLDYSPSQGRTWTLGYSDTPSNKLQLVKLSLHVLLLLNDSFTRTQDPHGLTHQVFQHGVKDMDLLFDHVVLVLVQELEDPYGPGNASVVANHTTSLHEELIVMLWRLVFENEAFRKQVVLVSVRLPVLVVALSKYVWRYRNVNGAQNFVFLVTLIWLQLSSHREFGLLLNQKVEDSCYLGKDSPVFGPCVLADVLVVSLHKVLLLVTFNSFI